MGRRWAWMGMVGVCALLTGCQQRAIDEQAAPVSARTPAPARPSADASPERVSAAPAAPVPAPAPAQRPVAQPSGTAPAQAAAPAQATAPAQGVASANTVPRPAPAAQQGTTVTESGATQEAPEGRVMIGSEAVQASEDEAWYEGAAKAARAARQNDSVPLNRVVIATGTVDGRITRVERNTVHVRDSEGNVYQLRIDKRSRGVRQGQSVPLQRLEEGTPVRASFDLVGGGSFARDIEVRR